MTTVYLTYTRVNGQQIKMTSEPFNNDLDAQRWMSWLNRILSKSEERNADKISVNMGEELETTTPVQQSTDSVRRSSRLRNRHC